MSFLRGQEHCESVVSLRRTENARERLTAPLLSLQVSFSLGDLSQGSQVIIMHFSARFSTLIFAAAIALVGCSGLFWEPPIPGSVMAESYSPDKSLSARVIATEGQGTYIFEVRKIRSGNILAEQTISAPIGYHAHIVWLTWSEDGRTVSATIDHDFGEGNRTFDLSIVSIDA